ncbi:MAG: hypothetical protein J6T10_17755 [Methanobrevibacter sp.]|nr:hypothetical protein [Methanobrevibacter sp.]
MSEETVENKFIFTTEGRNSLVSQLGGIRFAILGAVLVHGLTPLAVDEHKDLTLDSLTSMPGVILGLKNVNYISSENKGLSPENNYVYLEAIQNITNNLIPLHYIPSEEVVDSDSSTYGIYELEIDKTLINWDNKNDIAFEHIIFIGKQYAQTDDATYNVEKTQKPVLVAIGNIEGLELLAEQNEYVNSKLRIRLTLSEKDDNIGQDLDLTNPDTKEVLAIANKMSLVNNGVKTTKVPFSITDNKQIVDDFKLNENGALAMTKTLMVAETFDADDVENDFNGVGLMHLINAKDASRKFTPQVVLSTLEHIEQDEPVTGYNVEILLRGTSGETEVTGNAIEDGYDLPNIDIDYYGSDTDEDRFYNYDYSGAISPLFKIDSIPADDEIGVDIFGFGNKILETNDKLLFSKNNILWNSENSLPQDDTNKKENVLIASDTNFLDIKYGANILFGSIENAIKENSSDNGFFNSHYNILGHDATHINLFGSIDNRINVNYSYRDENSNDITILNSCNNSIDASNNTTLINSDGNTITYSENVALLNAHNSRVVNNIISQSLDTETHGHGVIINGKYNEIDFFEDVTLIGNGLRASDYRPYHTNYPLLILGKYNKFGRGYFVTGYTDNTQTTTTVYQPGIIYGNGTDDASRNNALEFYPELGLLRVKNKNGDWTELGGDNGLKLPDNVNLETINFKNKTNNTGIVSIDTTNTPTISVSNPAGAKTTIDPTTITVKGTNDEINTRIEVQRSSIDLYNKENKNKIKINTETYYQKARADITVRIKNNADPYSNPFEATLVYFKGPETIKSWLTAIWEKAPPIVYSTHNANNLANSKFTVKNAVGDWTNIGYTDYSRYVETQGTHSNAQALANYGLIKYCSPLNYALPEFTNPGAEELEINLYIEDYNDRDIHLLWVPTVTDAENFTDNIVNEIKLNIMMCKNANGDSGENIHYWAAQFIEGTNDTTNNSYVNFNIDNYDIDNYDKFITLISKPASLLTPTGACGWWRMN